MAKLEDVSDLDQGPDLSDDDAVRDAQEFLDEVESLIVMDHVQYARETLEGIYETVRERMRVTPAQREAVENIDSGGQRGDRRW